MKNHFFVSVANRLAGFRRSFGGFTLAELMAVVIIIAILAGIGLGSYQKAVKRSKAQEAITMGHAVMQSVARYYYDHPESSNRTWPDFSELDIDLTNGSASGKSFIGKNFTVVIYDGYVRVSSGEDGFQLDINQEAFGRWKNNQDECYNDEDLCISLGYTDCSGSCKKPL